MCQQDESHPVHKGASNSLMIKLRLLDRRDILGKVTALLTRLNIDVGAIENFRLVDDGFAERDLSVNLDSPKQGQDLVKALDALEGVEVLETLDPTFQDHHGGKLQIVSSKPIRTREDLSRIYTPGVARVCMAIHEKPELAYKLTMKGNTIAVVTNGTRVLALGDIGASASQPVMEGKAALFYRFAGINAVPMCLNVTDRDLLVEVVKANEPWLGGVNLEDISSPDCWYIERRLREEMNIPVFHDDQHGTAIVVLAATLNAAKLVKKQLRHLRVVVSGVGAAGMACCRLLIAAGVKHIVGFKKEGAVYPGREDLNEEEAWLAANTTTWHKRAVPATIPAALKGADMFLGLSVGNILKPEDLKGMRRDAIVFPLANPDPEVDPDGAREYARIIATGGSEYENQINNALAFPGVFRGALDARVPDITERMKMEAARALAAVIPAGSLREDNIIPSIFDEKVHETVANAVKSVARQTNGSR